MWWSPNSECFQPPKEWNAIGTGIGTFTPTMPMLIPAAKSRAAPPSEVKIATPLPYSCAFTMRTAPAMSGVRTTPSTGPKISSR